MSKAEDLKIALETYNTKHNFHVGQIVKWKTNMRNKRPEGPFIIVEILDPPIIDPEQDSGLPYFRELLTVKLGRLDSGCFVVQHYDLNRFQPA